MTVRHQHPVLVYGQYGVLDADNPYIYAYTRTLGKKRVLVVLNFTSKPQTWALPPGLKLRGKPWLNSGPELVKNPSLALQPWQAVVIALH